MANFFEKLKKGMGIELPSEEEKEERKEEKEKKLEKKEEKKERKKIELNVEKVEEEWPEVEGELAVDIYQTENDLVILSAIAGVKPENLDITIEGDILTIRGEREKPEQEKGDYFVQECYWGPFSRQIILPTEIDSEKIEAKLRDGILTIRLPKLQKEKKKKIKIKI